MGLVTMASLERYFSERDAGKPAPRWVYGDRVMGRVGKIPVMGMVIREDYEDAGLVLCHLDLPIWVKNPDTLDTTVRWIVLVPARGMKRLKEIQ
jgi:hypothetical protein